MAKLRFSETEIALIRAIIKKVKLKAKDQDHAWEETDLEGVKKNIKDYNCGRTTFKCCYCKRDLSNRYRSEMDSEHVLPKSEWPNFTFKIKNLSISCKRCNSTIKKTRTDFLTVCCKEIKNPFKSKYYKFLHPNLDKDPSKLILYVISVSGYLEILKYKYKGDKGKFTYDYFKLKDLEKESINEAQGFKPPKLSDAISGNTRIEILDMLEDI